MPSVAFEIPSQTGRSVPEASCPRLTVKFLSVRRLVSVLDSPCNKPPALPPLHGSQAGLGPANLEADDLWQSSKKIARSHYMYLS